MTEKVITDIGSSVMPGLEYVSEVVLKNYKPELSNILADLFNMFLTVSCFLQFKNFEERFMANNPG